MKLLFYTLLILSTALGCNNGKAEKQKIVSSNGAINTVDSAGMVNFPGTTIYIQLPGGYVWSEAAMGFYRDEDGSVIRHDDFKTMRYAAAMPVEENIGTLTKTQPIIVSGYTGEIKTYLQGGASVHVELSFGDTTFREFIEATYFTSKQQSEKDVLAALKSIQIKKKK